MKKTFTLFLIVLVAKMGFSQSWAEQGAVWYFNSAPPWFEGYTKVTYTGDTTINGKQCNILEKYYYGYYPSDHTNPISSVYGHEYVYQENGKVYSFKNNAFFTLYDFNANVGDSWTITGDSSMCDSTGTVIVDSTSTMVINGDTLKVLHVKCTPSSAWVFGFSTATLVEKIGSIGFIFPSTTCSFDADEAGALRCYSDNSSWSYETGIATACDFTIGINEVDQNDFISLSPNPASEILFIKKQTTDPLNLSILDVTCQVVYDNKKFAKESIDLKSFKNGVYFVRCTSEKNHFVKKFVVQR
jgi:hypothetical protein